MFLNKKTLLNIWLTPGWNLTIFQGTGPWHLFIHLNAFFSWKMQSKITTTTREEVIFVLFCFFLKFLFLKISLQDMDSPAQESFRQSTIKCVLYFRFVEDQEYYCGIENKNCNTQLINSNDFTLQLKDWPPHSKKRMATKVIKN